MARESGAVYDEDLFNRKKLYMAACSEENLSSIVDAVDLGMVWY